MRCDVELLKINNMCTTALSHILYGIKIMHVWLVQVADRAAGIFCKRPYGKAGQVIDESFCLVSRMGGIHRESIACGREGVQGMWGHWGGQDGYFRQPKSRSHDENGF